MRKARGQHMARSLQVIQLRPILPARAQTARRSGMAMLLVLCLISVVGLLILPVVQRAEFHHANAWRECRYISALHLAEAGIDDAIWQLSSGKADWEGWILTDPTHYKKPAVFVYDPHGGRIGQYEVEILGQNTAADTSAAGWGSVPLVKIANSKRPIIRATAGVPTLGAPDSEIRVVEVQARSQSVFSLGLFSDMTLSLTGSVQMDSFDSDVAPYNAKNFGKNTRIGSNNDVKLTGAVQVYGESSAGGKLAITGGAAKVYGQSFEGVSKIELPSVDDMVAAAKASNHNAAIPKACVGKDCNVTVYNPTTRELNVPNKAVWTLPGGTKDSPRIYYFSKLSISSSATVTINGHVVIYTDGPVDIGTNPNVGSVGGTAAPLFQLYSSSTAAVKMAGNKAFTAAVYAPKATLSLAGTADLYGAYIAKQVSFVGNAAFHYDEALGAYGPSLGFTIDHWVEARRPTSMSL